jgi:hypothetical protein
MMISCTAVFGGAGVANQISELKRGTEVREDHQTQGDASCMCMLTVDSCLSGCLS